jgi:anti-sigma regulatory factor (Ser/Thr protein kinase)
MIGDGRAAAGRPAGAEPVSYTYTTDLTEVRAAVRRHAVAAGLAEARVMDLVLAVSEVAANTIRHARSAGQLQIWSGAGEIVCQVHDDGQIADPLAGRRRPALDAMGGHGLWIVYQVCDDVEVASGEAGTTIRLHMRAAGP